MEDAVFWREETACEEGSIFLGLDQRFQGRRRENGSDIEIEHKLRTKKNVNHFIITVVDIFVSFSDGQMANWVR